jgi:hypothetical protein
VISARDEIWIDMVQFDVRAADRLWEGIPPAHGAPEWYDDVSGLIETASGPAEPHELADEPVVVEDMHKTTLGRPRRCRHGRTLGRVVAMKAAGATTASVLGVAAAAAATTGIVATMASVVVPAIEEHVLLADDDQDAVPAAPGRRDSGGTPDTRPERQPNDLAAAPPAVPATLASPRPAGSEPTVASASPGPAAPVAETAVGPTSADDPAPPGPATAEPPLPDPGGAASTPAVDPPTDAPGRSGPVKSASTGPEPARRPRVVDPPPTIQPPASDPPSVRGGRWSDKRIDVDTCARYACSSRGHYGAGDKAGHRGARAKAVELVKHGQPADPRRPG